MEDFEALVQGAVSKLRSELRAVNGGSVSDSIQARAAFHSTGVPRESSSTPQHSP